MKICWIKAGGAMDWPPNQDAVEWYARNIPPLIRRDYPGAVTWIVGRNPPSSVRALERAHPDLRVTGAVDELERVIQSAVEQRGVEQRYSTSRAAVAPHVR